MCKSKCGRVNQTELNNGQSFHDKIFFDEKVFTIYIYIYIYSLNLYHPFHPFHNNDRWTPMNFLKWN